MWSRRRSSECSGVLRSPFSVVRVERPTVNGQRPVRSCLAQHWVKECATGLLVQQRPNSADVNSFLPRLLTNARQVRSYRMTNRKKRGPSKKAPVAKPAEAGPSGLGRRDFLKVWLTAAGGGRGAPMMVVRRASAPRGH